LGVSKTIVNFKHYVCIITNKPKGVLYIGETGGLKKRIYQHKNKVHPTTFSARDNLDVLIYYEEYNSEVEAKLREKQMKKWNRDLKLELIEKANPDWKDFYEEI
jgi:putative endonuclease